MWSLLGRASVVWLAILAIAIGNGAFRQGVLVPWLGDATAHVLSTILLSCAVLGVAWLTIRWTGAGTSRGAWAVGAFWLLLTVSFEFLGGHYLFGTPWPSLLADYRVHEGRIWPLVLVVTFLSPPLAARLRA